MALIIPTTQQIKDANLSNYESELGQTAPINDQAFLRVESAVQAMMFTTLYKYAIERALQALAITATGEDLDLIGNNYGVTRTAAEAAQLEIDLPATTGTTIPITVTFIGDDNQVIYRPDASVVSAGGIATIDTTANETGEVGDLIVGQTMTMTSQIAGAENSATVTAVLNAGVAEESDDSYRRRVLDEIRTVGGGSNKADYRRWAEGDSNVERAYPYAGRPSFDTVPLLDGDCEDSTIASWAPGIGNSALLTKSTANPRSGTYALRIAENGQADPYTSQTIYSLTEKYLSTGYARGNGTAAPVVQNQAGVNLWTGTSSTSWQAFSINFSPSNTKFIIGSDALVSSADWVEFDDMTADYVDLPGQRTVYIEAISSIDADGIAPSWLLVDARTAILTDPDTGQTRPSLGTIADDLFVRSIIRTTFDIQIVNLQVASELEIQVKADISTSVSDYLLSTEPFITGLDFEGDAANVITQLTIGDIVQDILGAVGGYADAVLIAISGGAFVSSYTLRENEKAKLGTVTYV